MIFPMQIESRESSRCDAAKFIIKLSTHLVLFYPEEISSPNRKDGLSNKPFKNINRQELKTG